MDDEFPERLQQEQKAAVAELQARLSTWKAFQNDYKALEETLNFLPSKVTHDVMVPFGSLAFMPGKLIHTNEILVLLGDNWFAERSALQAVEIVKRRQQSIEENIKTIKNEIDFFTSQINFSQDVNKEKDEFVEIKEELQGYEGPSRGQRVAHKKSKDFAPKRVKKFDSHSLRGDLSFEDKDLFAKLDKLEAQERINQELLNPFKSNEEPQIENQCQDARHSGVSFSQEVKTEGEDRDSGEEYEDTNKTIRVNFTQASNEETVNLPSNQLSINTPTDIYNRMKQKPMSILKSTSFEKEAQEPKSIPKSPSFEIDTQDNLTNLLHQTQQNELASQKHVEKPNLSIAFSGEVIDRTAKDSESISNVQTTKSEPKRVSKFKAQRKK